MGAVRYDVSQVPDPDDDGKEQNPLAIDDEQRQQALLNLTLTKEVLHFDQSQEPNPDAFGDEQNPWAPSEEQLIQGQVNIGLRATVRFDEDQRVPPWEFTEVDRARARRNIGIDKLPEDGKDGKDGAPGAPGVLDPSALGSLLGSAGAGSAIGLGALALLAALFGWASSGKDDTLNIDKLRDKILGNIVVRTDIKQDLDDDQKGRARNNIGAQVGDPGWYFNQPGAPGGVNNGSPGYGGIIGAPIPIGGGGGGSVTINVRRTVLVESHHVHLMQRHIRFENVKQTVAVHPAPQTHLLQRNQFVTVERRSALIHPTQTSWATDQGRLRRLEARLEALVALLIP